MYYNDQPAEAIYYQGCAWRALGDEGQARSRFYKLRDYGSDHLNDIVSIDYFAVSLPDFLLFEEDLNEKNKQFCHGLLGLGLLGLGNYRRAVGELEDALRMDPSDQIAAVHLDIARGCRDGDDGPEVRALRGQQR
jgi:tetratricopeptide (TPR) repeat protein